MRLEPDLFFFEPKALDYPVGEQLYRRFQERGVPLQVTPSHNRVTGIPVIHRLHRLSRP